MKENQQNQQASESTDPPTKVTVTWMKKTWHGSVVTSAYTLDPSALQAQGFEVVEDADSALGLAFCLFSPGDGSTNPIPGVVVPVVRANTTVGAVTINQLFIGSPGQSMNAFVAMFPSLNNGYTIAENLGYTYVSNADPTQDLAQLTVMTFSAGNTTYDYVYTTDQLVVSNLQAAGYSANASSGIWVMPVYTVDVYLNHRNLKIQVRPLIDNRLETDPPDQFYVGSGLDNCIVFQSSDPLPWTFQSIVFTPPLLIEEDSGANSNGVQYIRYSDSNRASGQPIDIDYTITIEYNGQTYSSDPKIVNRTPLNTQPTPAEANADYVAAGNKQP